MASPAVIAALITATAVVIGGTVVGVEMKKGQDYNSDNMLRGMLDKNRVDMEGQFTERKRILSEKQQADNWLAFDYNEARADRVEAIEFQRRMDSLMNVNQSERYIEQASARAHYPDHSYPPLAA